MLHAEPLLSLFNWLLNGFILNIITIVKHVITTLVNIDIECINKSNKGLGKPCG